MVCQVFYCFDYEFAKAMIDLAKLKYTSPMTDSDFVHLNGARDFVKSGYSGNTVRPYMLINMAYDQLIA